MKKILSAALVICMLVCAASVPASAADIELYPSYSIFAFISERETFRQQVYESHGKYYIGYGTECSPQEWPEGIDAQTASVLLEMKLAEISNEINSFAKARGFSLTQERFDALVSFTFHMGPDWMKGTTRITKCLESGSFSNSEFANAMGVWCHLNGEVVDSLAQRRIEEIKIFLFGDYTSQMSPEIAYLIMDAAGGEAEDDICFFFTGENLGTLPSAYRNGYSFQGWYGPDGTRLSENTVLWEGGQATAKWARSDGWANTYSDVPSNAWYYDYVASLSARGVIDGYPDGTFRPKGLVTNGEALKLILLAAGYEAQEPLQGEHWASGYYALAADSGFIDRMPMDLNKPMDRLNVARLTAAALGLGDSGIVTPFYDTDDRSVLALYNIGILTGSYDNTGRLMYLPGDGIVRSEVSAVVWRIMSYLGTGDEPGPDENDPPDPVAGSAGTGLPWQVQPIEGVPVYNYDSSGFYTQDGIKYYEANGIKAKVGIDVSQHQGEINWRKVAAAGVEFAMIRVGFRGYSDGNIYEDTKFRENIAGALEAGIDVGVYFFSQAINPEEAEEEVRFVLDRIAGYNIIYPVAYDWEDIYGRTARTDGITTRLLCSCANTFCDAVEQAGYRSMVYFNTYIGLMLYDLSRIMQYDFWYAGYTGVPDFYYDFDMWQYWDSGRIDGIPEKVDMNLCFKEYR